MTKLGATGKFPEGKLTPSDEGELQFVIAIDSDLIVLAFGKPVAWLAMGADKARELARSLTKFADELEDTRDEVNQE